jgi:tetratricopeptide (TPR) repeat protein
MTALRRAADHLHARPALAAVIVGLLAIAVYANTLSAGFVWDDASSILLHQHVKDPSKIFALFTEDQHAFAGGQGNFYRPLLSVTFLIDYAIARIGQPRIAPAEIPTDLNPFVFHLTSAFSHAAAAMILLLYLRRLGAPIAVYLPAVAIFAVHPLHTEAVAYVSGRADSMAAVFVFAALYFSTWRAPDRSPRAGLVLMLVCFAAGLLSKEAAFVFPPLLILSRIARPAGESRSLRAWIPEFASLALLGIYFLLRTTVLSFGSDTVAREATWTTRLAETFEAFALYLRLLFVPTNLHMERSLDGVPGWLAPAGILLAVALMAVAFAAYRTGHRRSAFGFAWFFAAWLPISGLFPLNAPMAEHWMYIPMAGFFFGVCGVTHALLKKVNSILHVAAIAALASWLVALSVLTVARNRDWRDDESLYIATLRENPNSTRVHFNLAVVYQDILDNPAGARRHFLAVTRAYEKRKEANPAERDEFWADELEAHLSLGELYAAEHRYAEAFQHYRVVLGIAPTGPNALLVAQAAYGAALCFLNTGDYAEARTLLEQAVRLAPELQPEAARLLPPGAAQRTP